MSLNAFISYSHADNKFLEDLHKHLAMLKRERALNAWSDHDILAGDEGAVVRGVEKTVFPLANRQLQRPLRRVIVQRRTFHL